MAQDGLANLKEGVEEAFADLGISFQLKEVRDNLFVYCYGNSLTAEVTLV